MDFISFFLQLQNKEIPDHVLILVPFVKKIGTKDIQNCSRWKQQTNEKKYFFINQIYKIKSLERCIR